MSDEELRTSQEQPANAATAPEPESAAASGPATAANGDGAAQLAALQAKANEYLEGWQRARAEFANYKKRIERDVKDTYQNATSDAIKQVLPIIDDFERALANVPPDLQDNPWVNGVTMIHRKFERVMDSFNITIVDPVGQPFDPNLHEAVGEDDKPDVKSGLVTVTMQKGYMLGDRVLRPALVRVAR